MSTTTQKTEEPVYATEGQKATWEKLGNSFYKTTMSNAISVVTNFDLLKAVGTGNVAEAQAQIAEVIRKNKESREAYLASQKSE